MNPSTPGTPARKVGVAVPARPLPAAGLASPSAVARPPVAAAAAAAAASRLPPGSPIASASPKPKPTVPGAGVGGAAAPAAGQRFFPATTCTHGVSVFVCVCVCVYSLSLPLYITMCSVVQIIWVRFAWSLGFDSHAVVKNIGIPLCFY